MTPQIQLLVQLTLIVLLAGLSAYFRALSAASAHLAETLAPDRRGFRLTLEPKWAFWSATLVYGFSILILLGALISQGALIGGAAILVFAAVHAAMLRFVVPASTSSYWPRSFHERLFKRATDAIRANRAARDGDTAALIKAARAMQLEADAMQLLMAHIEPGKNGVDQLVESARK